MSVNRTALIKELRRQLDRPDPDRSNLDVVMISTREANAIIDYLKDCGPRHDRDEPRRKRTVKR